MAARRVDSFSQLTTGAGPQLFTSALQFFTATQYLITENWPYDACVENCEVFDFIIVGAGTAGCVLANRLSEVEEWRVLLIEAGGDPPVESIIPYTDETLLSSKYDWQYVTQNDGRINQAFIDKSIKWPRGLLLGGSSSINGMTYVKGNPNDYQTWYDEGNKEWHPNVVDKYFKKAESYQNIKNLQNIEIKNGYGLNGPLVINNFNSSSSKTEIAEGILSAWEEIGIRRVSDVNAARSMGCGYMAASAANGVRQSSVKDYVNTIRDRPNLKVVKDTFVTEVLIDKSNRAYGVKAECNGTTMTLIARVEVIISAGSVNTPQLLLLSGIGQKHHLDSKNITCKVNSPMVGQNLQDHISMWVPIFTNISNSQSTINNYDLNEYLYNRTGLLAQKRHQVEVIAFYSSSSRATKPEFQNHISVVYKNSSEIINIYKDYRRYQEPIPSSVAELNKKFTLLEFNFNLLHPVSKGNITLRSKNPKDKPIIFANYFINQTDLELTITGIKMLTKIVNTRYMKSVGAFLGRFKWPACDRYKLDSRGYWGCICTNMVFTTYHPIGTAKMGSHIRNSVVDSRLRVHGVKRLRVVDASVMPSLTSGNTNGPTFMIAERGADLIKEEYTYKCIK